MRSNVYYGTRFGCRFGQPHDFATLADRPGYKVERCRICRARRRWNKGFGGRIDNVRYLRDHVRSFAQEYGSTRRVFYKVYQPEKTTIYL